MYTPAHFANHDQAQIKDFIRSNAFGIIICAVPEIHATHIPLELSDDGTVLSGHVSKANPQAGQFTDGTEVLCVFNGPHTYISSSWYDHENVPTWNYMAVHARGTLKLISGALLYERLAQITDKYEAASEKPVSLQGMSADFVARHMNGVVGFDVEITSINALYKLSQNRNSVNHASIMHALEKRGDHNSMAIATEMKKRNPEKSHE
jgi:transcriptional regulator